MISDKTFKYVTTETPEEAINLICEGKLSHAELADTFAYLREIGIPPNELKEKTGISQPQIRHYCRISKSLISVAKEYLHVKKITVSHAKAVASVSPDIQKRLIEEILSKKKSVHKLRIQLKNNEVFKDDKSKQYFEDLEHKMSDKTGINLTIVPDSTNTNSGNVSLRYTDLRDFDKICETLGFDLSQL